MHLSSVEHARRSKKLSHGTSTVTPTLYRAIGPPCRAIYVQYVDGVRLIHDRGQREYEGREVHAWKLVLYCTHQYNYGDTEILVRPSRKKQETGDLQEREPSFHRFEALY